MPKNERLDIDRVAFIGRTYAEYMRMFGLNEALLQQGSILDCAAGPSSFSAEAHQKGMSVTACDLLYDVSIDTLVQKSRNDVGHVFDKFDEVSHLYTWSHYQDKKQVIALRHEALDAFALDFPEGCTKGRYVRAELPCLPFPDKSFSLVLCSHFLFLYNDRLSFDFLIASLKEMLRVSFGEVRIFPIQGLDAKPYPRMKEMLAALGSDNIVAEIFEVPFEFQRGSNKVMKLRHSGAES